MAQKLANMLIGMAIIVAVVGVCMGPFVWALNTPLPAKSETVEGSINGRIISICADRTKDLIYIYQDTQGKPVGIAVVKDGCAD